MIPRQAPAAYCDMTPKTWNSSLLDSGLLHTFYGNDLKSVNIIWRFNHSYV